jgi:copper resistance protein D
VDELIVVSRAVHFVAAALLFGAPLFRLTVAADELRGERAIEIAAAFAALLSGFGWFAGVAASMAGSWSDAVAPDMLQAVVFDTRFGRLWTVRLALLAAILAIHVVAKPSRARNIALAILCAAFMASLVGVGHGMAGGAGGDAVAPVHMAADVIHLLCAATWIGGLFCLGRLLASSATPNGNPDAIRAALPRFSRIGYWAVALLLLSGCVNALILVPRPERLFGTDYGRVLLVKIALALLMVAIAVVNRVVLTPKVVSAAEPAAAKALWRSVLVEQGVGLLVLAIVARLGTIHPVP